jgi:hypothetical protein
MDVGRSTNEPEYQIVGEYCMLMLRPNSTFFFVGDDRCRDSLYPELQSKTQTRDQGVRCQFWGVSPCSSVWLSAVPVSGLSPTTESSVYLPAIRELGRRVRSIHAGGFDFAVEPDAECRLQIPDSGQIQVRSKWAIQLSFDERMCVPHGLVLHGQSL